MSSCLSNLISLNSLSSFGYDFSYGTGILEGE